MKKLMTLIAVALFTTATFAQDNKTMTKPEAAPATPAQAGQTAPAAPKAKHEWYMMKDGALMHCMDSKTEAQKTPVVLVNGATLSPSGELKSKDGTTVKLENGQCMTMVGAIGDCEKMVARMKQAPKTPPAPDKTK